MPIMTVKQDNFEVLSFGNKQNGIRHGIGKFINNNTFLTEGLNNIYVSSYMYNMQWILLVIFVTFKMAFV